MLAEDTWTSRLNEAARALREEEMMVLGTSAGGVREAGMEGYATMMLVGDLGS